MMLQLFSPLTLCETLSTVATPLLNATQLARPHPASNSDFMRLSSLSWQRVNPFVLMLFSSTRGQRSHHSSHHHLHPAAGHFGERTLLPLQKGKNLRPVRKTRPVRPEGVCG